MLNPTAVWVMFPWWNLRTCVDPAAPAWPIPRLSMSPSTQPVGTPNRLTDMSRNLSEKVGVAEYLRRFAVKRCVRGSGFVLTSRGVAVEKDARIGSSFVYIAVSALLRLPVVRFTTVEVVRGTPAAR